MSKPPKKKEPPIENTEIQGSIDCDGLEYAFQEYDGHNFKDKHLKKLWKEARDAFLAVEHYLADTLYRDPESDYYGWDSDENEEDEE